MSDGNNFHLDIHLHNVDFTEPVIDLYLDDAFVDIAGLDIAWGHLIFVLSRSLWKHSREAYGHIDPAEAQD